MASNQSFFLLFLLTILAAESSAQLNESDSIRWQLKYSATGSILTGNVSRTLLLNGFEVAHAPGRWGLSTRNDYQYGRTFGRQTENDITSYNYLYLHPLARSYPYFKFLAEANLRRKIDFRYQFGPGVSWNIVQGEGTLIKLSLNSTYERTHFNGNEFDEARYNGSDRIETWRVTGRVFGIYRLKGINSSYEFWLQQSVRDSANFRYRADVVLELPITRRIAFRTAFRYTYESIHLAGIKPYDLFWTYGLAVTNF